VLRAEQIRTTKGAFGRLLFLFLLALPALAQPAACPPPPATPPLAVRHVIDGDTLILADGRHVRLIGINTPETAKRDQPGEPLAQEAKQALSALLAAHGNQVRLVFGAERKDRYGRTLAYVYTGSEPLDVGAELLRQGLGLWIVIAPNAAHVACYPALETAARAARAGLWGLAEPPPLAAGSLADRAGGFVLTGGTVTGVREPAGHLVIELDHTVELFIHRRRRQAFALDPATLPGRRFEARGWLYRYRNKPNLRLDDPAMLRATD